jgi:hypothetical protein
MSLTPHARARVRLAGLRAQQLDCNVDTKDQRMGKPDHAHASTAEGTHESVTIGDHLTAEVFAPSGKGGSNASPGVSALGVCSASRGRA